MKNIFLLTFLSIILPGLLSLESCSLNKSFNTTSVGRTSVTPDNSIEEFQIFKLNGTEDGSKCLDGSDYIFYMKFGTGDGANKWQFYFEGAAFCGTDDMEFLESCYGRSYTTYGTSQFDKGENGTHFLFTQRFGYFSSSYKVNPKFYNWNKVYMLECTGTMFQGSLEEPLYYNGMKLYFRGYNNTMGTLEYLKKNFGLFNASEVFLTGASSGAAAVFQYSSYLDKYFPKTTKIFALIDSGFFIDSYNEFYNCYYQRYALQRMAYYLNLSSSPLYSACTFTGDEFWRCLMIEYTYDVIKIPVFIAQSQYDREQLASFDGISCVKENFTECGETAHKIFVQNRERILSKLLQVKKEKPKWGIWLRSCFEHGFYETMAWYGELMVAFSAEALESSNLKKYLYEWYDGLWTGEEKTQSYIDLVDWEHNDNCTMFPTVEDAERTT